LTAEVTFPPKKGALFTVQAVWTKTSWHIHIETTLDGRDAGMSAAPVGHDIPLEVKLLFEETIESHGVLTGVRAI
jgi:hypothetical protein